jgi:hypothetical protein
VNFHGNIPGRVLEVVCGALLLVGMAGRAQSFTLSEAPISATSISGQFIVHGRDATRLVPKRELRPVGNDPVIQLRPDLLTVTCERVKRAVQQRLGLRDDWRGKVHLHLHRQPTIERSIAIHPQVYRDGWQFHVALPDQIEWTRLVRAISEVVLLEMANRENNSTACAQPPLWLAEGMNQLVLGDYGRDLVIESQTTLNRSNRKPDPLVESRAALRGRDPWGFSALTLATVEQLTRPEDFTHFQASATLLVHLLTGESRRAKTVDFIRTLPENLNWQTAFLALNRAEFSTLLEAEKWWAVNATHELSVDPELFWNRGEVLRRLADILSETAAVRTPSGPSSAAEVIPLSRVVSEWDFATQHSVLQRKVAQLQILLMRTPKEPAELRQLVTESFRTLDRYLTERGGSLGPENAGRGEVGNRIKVLAKTAARRLDAVEQRVAAAQR